MASRPLRARLSLTLALGGGLAACSGPSAMPPGPQGGEAPELRASVRRTAYGVVHVVADDLRGVAFGQGYAVAEDHLCTLADQFVKVRSERAAYFGPGPAEANLASDFGYLALGVRARAEAAVTRVSPAVRELLEGFVRGYNEYLKATPPATWPPACASAPWVKPIDVVDLFAHYIDLGLVGLPQALLATLAAATPPPPASTVAPAATVDLPLTAKGASNGWALGRDATTRGHGIVVANPHFPWEGELMLHEVHLRVPGRLHVYGASLLGVAGVLIGFNERVAWTHTFSAATQSTLYALDLDPNDATRYRVGDGFVPLEARDFTVGVRIDGGEVVPITRRLYASQHGPIVTLPSLPWTSSRAYALRSANAENETMAELFLRKMTAGSLEELEAAHREERGMPWANTLAADQEGRVLYMDSTRVPHLSAGALARWKDRSGSDLITRSLADRGIVLLDGGEADDSWQPSPDRPGDFVVPWAESPRLARTDFVFNANDSYWLAQPAAPLTGFSPLFGATGVPQSARTRMNASILGGAAREVAAGEDRRFDRGELRAALLDGRSYAPEALGDRWTAACAAGGASIAPACAVLAGWSGKFDTDSAGAVLVREVLGALEEGGPGLYAIPFDAADPLRTPRELPGDDATRARVVAAVEKAAARLAAAGLPLDASLGRAQFTLREGARVPVGGCRDGLEGCANVVRYTRLASTLAPPHPRGPVQSPRTGLTAEGYPINYGTSFVMVVEMTDAGPEGEGLLTYGESGDPRSPHAVDQLPLFARRELRPLLFREDAIQGDPALRVVDLVSRP